MWWGMEGFSAKECQAALCQLTDPVSSLPPCCRPYLVSVRHRGATEPWRRSARRADRRPRASAPVTRTHSWDPKCIQFVFTNLSVIVLMVTNPTGSSISPRMRISPYVIFKQLFIKMQRLSIQIIKRGKRFLSNGALCDECCSLWGP